MGRITRPAGGHTGRPRRRRLGTLVLLLTALGLVACDPPPPPDGRDLAIEVADPPTDLAPGERVALSVAITNHGGVAASGARVAFQVPSHLTVATPTGAGVSGCTRDGDLGACLLGTIDPGQTRTIAIEVTGALASPARDLVVAARSNGSEPSPDPHPNVARLPIAVGTGATVDLQVQGELPDSLTPRSPFTSTSRITNRSGSAASQVAVTQELSTGTVTAARFRRPLPGGGMATGSCSTVGRTVRCTTDGALVEPTAVLAERWVLEVDVLPGSDAVTIVHAVTSPHPEPEPDTGPNTATTHATFGRGIWFGAVPPVAPGQVFDVSGGATTEFPIPAYFVSLSLPANVEAVSVTIDGRTTPCQPTGGCTAFDAWGIRDGSAVSMRLRAVAAGPPANVTLRVSTYGFTVSGGTTVLVVDPSITSEVHPELGAATDGVVGITQALLGTVRNSGSTAHPDVTATIELPSSVRIDDARWGEAALPCATSGSTATCHIGALPAYGASSVTVLVTPTAPGPATVTMRTATTTAQDEPDPVADVDTATFDVAAASVDLALEPYVSLDPATEGVPWQVVPTIRNLGNVPAGGTRLVATLPDGVEISTAYLTWGAPADAGGCGVVGQAVTCRVGTVPAGGSVNVIIATEVTEGDAGPVRITVASDHPEPVPDPNPNVVVHDLRTVAPHADLRAEFDRPPTAVVTGQPVTIAHRVDNPDGPSVVEDAVGTLEVPPGWTITSAEWDRFGERVPCAVTASTSTCAIGLLTPDYGVTLYATVVPGAPEAGATLVATASSSVDDEDPSNDTATHALDVIAATTDLGVTATHDATAPAGGPSVVDLRVTNAGPAAAADTTITADLPATVGLDEVDTGATGFSCDATGQVLTCTHPLLPTGPHDLRLTLRDTALGPVGFTVTATTATTQSPDVLPDAVTILRTVTATPAAVTGTLVDPDGAPVADAAVWVYREGETSFVASGTSGADGSYLVSGLAPGRYQVRFVPGRLQDEWYDDRQDRAEATVFTADDLGRVFVADAELAPRVLTVVRGRVVDAAGRPVAGVTVGAYLSIDRLAARVKTTTAADGTYALTLPSGEYRLRFGPPAGSGLAPEWYDDQALRAAATPLLATGLGQVIVADAELAAAV